MSTKIIYELGRVCNSRVYSEQLIIKKSDRMNTLIIKITSFITVGCLFFLFTPNIFAEQKYQKTPSDQEGPFFPIGQRLDEDNDLTRVNGSPHSAQGKYLVLKGRVINTNGKPIEAVTIQIWQTDQHSRYLHPYDSSKGERDPFFQYWGKAVTDKEGNYSFKTLLPGAYEPRPAHIHFKVFQDGKERLTSQMYFKNHPDYTEYTSIPERYILQMVDLKKKSPGEYEGFFQIVLD